MLLFILSLLYDQYRTFDCIFAFSHTNLYLYVMLRRHFICTDNFCIELKIFTQEKFDYGTLKPLEFLKAEYKLFEKTLVNTKTWTVYTGWNIRLSSVSNKKRLMGPSQINANNIWQKLQQKADRNILDNKSNWRLKIKQKDMKQIEGNEDPIRIALFGFNFIS